ncbi:MAG: hydroxymethylbilane synthase [Candidatus Dadabacteria bacterium]|nr:hydroxymethylbilane synthase [Candidatus Dadabacteria bacterium]NIS09238.1 hydroxymethylbilane synthase [Candidatus Dadabacteria bacterium]NIV41886.1 hydroxymethylbilane synthase [Candidatus Dadabacteria bacterium]NIX15784.1 hydroxymethylbilane synthase [Candidatus Dadabacteria bacterium]NIY22514.1 hydroxymethylbilane synthase [Candidatus Dadabacteria bacterium]
MISKSLIRIGTRGSKLALWQANFVKDSLQSIFPKLVVYLKIIRTTGDSFTDRPLADIGGKGLFVKEIEEALLSDSIDIAVHSMKDVPAELPPGLEISTFLAREDPRDVLLSNGHVKFADLPPNARLGTGSLRRQVQIARLRDDLDIKPLRGNVDTRIRKLIEGQYDAIVLASAGLNRLELGSEITEHFSAADLIPSPGQGIIGIESRIDDQETREIVYRLKDIDAVCAIGAERNFVKQMGGDCSMPLGCYCEIKSGSEIEISGFVASVDGKDLIKDKISGVAHENIRLSEELAKKIIFNGGKEIIDGFANS